MSTRTRYVVGIVLVLAMVLSVVSLIIGPQTPVGSSPRADDVREVIPAVLHLGE